MKTLFSCLIVFASAAVAAPIALAQAVPVSPAPTPSFHNLRSVDGEAPMPDKDKNANLARALLMAEAMNPPRSGEQSEIFYAAGSFALESQINNWLSFNGPVLLTRIKVNGDDTPALLKPTPALPALQVVLYYTRPGTDTKTRP